MEKNTMMKKAVISGFALTALAAALSQTALAVEYDLCAGEVTINVDNTNVPMWGFGLEGVGTGNNCSNASVPGPELIVPPGDTTLVINLRNAIANSYLDGNAPISIVIPGQAMPVGGAPVFFNDGENRQRVRSFTSETLQGQTVTYTWNNLRPGTYLYHSGTHPQVQVQMGLYGAVTKDDGVSGTVYGENYSQDALLIISEIDVSQHTAIENGDYGTGLTSTVNYNADYTLVNGVLSGAGALVPSPGLNPDQSTLLRYINAGYTSRSLGILNVDVTKVAEDGYQQAARSDSNIQMPALKTTDVMLENGLPTGEYPIIDATEGPGAVLAKISVTIPAPVPKIYFSTVGNIQVPDVVAGTPNGNPIDDADIYLQMSDGSYSRAWEARYSGGGANNLAGNADIDGLARISDTDFYVSFVRDAGTDVPGLGTVQDEDIVHYDNGTWAMIFDGSVYGLDASNGQDIDALDIVDGTIYFSTAGSGVSNPVGTLGAYDDADVYSWDGSSFSRAFDGSNNGLQGNADIDALSVLAVDVNGNLTNFCASFRVDTVVNSVAVLDDEVICYDNGAWNTTNKFVSDPALDADPGLDIDALDLP